MESVQAGLEEVAGENDVVSCFVAGLLKDWLMNDFMLHSFVAGRSTVFEDTDEKARVDDFAWYVCTIMFILELKLRTMQMIDIY